MARLLTLCSVLNLLLAGVFGSFPLIDCDYSEKDLTFVVDCQSNVEEQINFVEKVEYHVRNERKWKISKVRFCTTLKTNEQVINPKFNLSTKANLEKSTKSTRTVSFNSEFKNSSTPEPNISSSTEFNEILIDSVDKQTVESKRKIFFITEQHIPSKYIYRKSSFKDLNVQELYRLVCDVKCTQTSLTFTSHGFQQSFYHIDKVSNITFMDGVQYCRSKYNSYMLSIETHSELEYVISRFKNITQSTPDKLIVGLRVQDLHRKNFWESGNPFKYYISHATCFYLDANTSFSAEMQIYEHFITYPCDESLSSVYLPCECMNYLPYNGYHRINIAKEFDLNDWVLVKDFFVTNVRKFEYESLLNRKIILDEDNCTHLTGAKIDLHFLKIIACNNKLVESYKPQRNIRCLKPRITMYFYLGYYICYYYDNDLYNTSASFYYPEIYRCITKPRSYNIKSCQDVPCPKNYYKCLDSFCINLTRVADGLRDCPFGDDELLFTKDDKICSGILTVKVNKILTKNACPGGIPDCRLSNATIIKKEITLEKFKLLELKTPLYKASNSLLPHKTIILHFSNVDILEIHTQHCEIKNVETAFKDWKISKLIKLDVSFNEIIELNNLTTLSQLLYLNVSHNELLTIGDEYMFPHLLQVIDLSYTNILTMPKKFMALSNLKYLNLGNTKITNFEVENLFPSLLEFLDLSYTNIQSLPLNLFKSLINLKHLNLRNTKIKSFHDIQMPPKFELFTLDMRGLNMEDVTVNYFHNLNITSLILADDYKLCCPVVLGKLIPPDKCIAPRDVISTCQHLVGDTFKRVTIWIIGILTLTGNGAVLIYRLVWSKQLTAKSYDTFVTGLAVSDLLMGIYLITIASVDAHYRDEYVFKDSEWKRGYFCLFSGFLSTLSNELSTFFICLITLDRFIAIRFPFRTHSFSNTLQKWSVLTVCLTAFVLALIPAIYPTWQIYSSNGLCLALPFNSNNFFGWQYSVAIFMILNFILFIIIAFGQVAIFASIHSRKRASETIKNNPSVRAQEISVAKKLAFVAVSDFLCWFPIGIMGMFSLNGHEFGPDVYAWTAVFVLPVNSAVNPLIYTLPAIYNRIRQLD
ncbi:hypothetical protein Btru_059138 [Bulinus truncatus]|nr:hypothetical protein Btru_059138 [Bulinus truncatus]